MSRLIRLTSSEAERWCKLIGKPLSHYTSLKDGRYRLRVDAEFATVILEERSGSRISPEITENVDKERLAELEQMFSMKNTNVQIYDILPKPHEHHESTAICLLSDVHIEETVSKEAVLGLNEYNTEIAKIRIDNFFRSSAKLITHAQRSYNMPSVVLGVLGDMISGYIHEELMQTNGLTPLEAVGLVKSCLLSGLKYWNDNLKVDKITVVMVVGNHARTTQKSQFGNASKMNYEYFLYKDIQEICALLGYKKINFIIPEAEIAVVNIYGKRILFTHGTHIRGGNGVGGIAVPLSRWFNRIARSLNIDYAMLGHFHQSIFNKQFMVNGSVIGYNSFAMGCGCECEVAQQTMAILDEKRGFTAYQSIYLD